MPAVSVLPIGSTPVGSVHVATDSQLMDTMRKQDELPEPEPVSRGSEGGEPGPVVNQQTPPPQSKGGDDVLKPLDSDRKDGSSAGGTVSPSQSSASYPHALPAHLTPQQPGYYVAYQSQITPEPPSPGLNAATMYDVGFLQQPTGFHPNSFAAQQYSSTSNPGQQPGQAPPSPSQTSMGGIPPASPIFPRMTGQGMGFLDPHVMVDGHRGAPVSPSPAYISPALGPTGGMYPGMNAYGVPSPNGMNNGHGGPEDNQNWTDGRSAQYMQSSPQIGAQGMQIPYVPGMPSRATSGGRSHSFEETMLPPPADSQQSQEHTANLSSYNVNQSNNGTGTLFPPQQSWGYGGPPPDMYGASASPLQPRPTMPYPMAHSGMPRHNGPQMGHYGNQFFPATSPGPPIQTTASNKGPDGANLFIFHIPNHFTNMDMYQLFYQYGHLLSVRIMVEKDSGRSRGFGFVSYDSPEAAALAIKELNGFAIGNKRLKVQHKQIRPSDQHSDRSQVQNYPAGPDNSNSGGGGYNRSHMSLPPSGPNSWFEQPRTAAPNELGGGMANIEQAGMPPTHDAPGENQDALSNLDNLREALPDEGGIKN